MRARRTWCRRCALTCADMGVVGGAQVNLDYESEEDMVEKMRIGLALQPLATALFANSPFRNGQDSGAPRSRPALNPKP